LIIPLTININTINSIDNVFLSFSLITLVRIFGKFCSKHWWTFHSREILVQRRSASNPPRNQSQSPWLELEPGPVDVVGARGIGHLVYPSRICQCTDIPNTVDPDQRSGAFTTSIRGDPLRTPDLGNHSRWFFSSRALAAVSQTRRVGNIAPTEREELISACDIVFGFTLSIFTSCNYGRSDFPCKAIFLKLLFTIFWALLSFLCMIIIDMLYI
jgi:hypothetical protein